MALFAALIAFTASYGQLVYEPQILILSPYKVTYDKVLEQQVAALTMEIKEAQKAGKITMLTDDTTGRPENIKIMVQHEKAFARTLDFSNVTSFIAGQYLSYFFFERFPNLLILVKDIKSNGRPTDLKKIAGKEQLQYVLNFPTIHFYREAGISKAKVFVQLYDMETDVVVLNKEFSGDWNNPGSQFTCRDSSLMCTINNALAPALGEVMEIVAVNSQVFRDEEQRSQENEALSDRRFEVLVRDYYPRSYDSAFISNIISPTDTGINSKALYHAVIDDTKTKFIAFYFDTDREPKTLYIVKAAKYKEQWVYQKTYQSNFGSGDLEMMRRAFFTSLQEWGFFKEGKLEFDPQFWETNQFEKVKDIKKDPDWNKYQEMWAAEEHENRDYVGTHEFVANELKKRRKEENDKFDSLTGRNVFLPFYEAQKKANPARYAEFIMWGKKPTLIFPKHRKYVLNPISVTDSAGQRTLHFYFAFAGSETVYEWTYLQPVPIKRYSGEIIEQLGTVTQWNFSYSTLDDDQFWENYVLAKSGNEYKYLKRLQ